MKIMVSMSALAPSQYRKFVKGWDKGRYAGEFAKFAGKLTYRIYLPLDNEAEAKIPAPQEIADTISSLGWDIEDYRAGIAVDKKEGKRRIRIGKLLTKHPHLLKQFNEDKARAAYRGKYMICISRHPYDIAGASTDRGWTSCMNLEDGENAHYIPKEIKIGSLIAYLIEEHDTNIKRPAARTMIKPFYKTDDVEMKYPLLIADPSVYGTSVKGFVKTVQRWLDKHMNHRRTNGVYKIHHSSYEDGYDSHLKTDDSPESLRFNYELRIDSNGYLTSMVSDDERRMAFRAYPQLLRLCERMKLIDWRCAADRDPDAAFQILMEHPERIFDGSDGTRSLKQDEHLLRYEARMLINHNEGKFFTQADKVLDFRDDEIADMLYMNGGTIAPHITVNRWNPKLIRHMVAKMTNEKLLDIARWIPRQHIPDDPVERVTMYPRMLLFFKQPTLALVKGALSGADKDEWKAIVFTMNSNYLTSEIADYIISWLMANQQPNDILRFCYERLTSAGESKSPVVDNPKIVERCLAFCEKEGIDMKKHYRHVTLMNLLSPTQRLERYKSGMYFNVLEAAFEEKALKITEAECVDVVKLDDGVDFFRASVDLLYNLGTMSPEAFAAGIDITSKHPHVDTVLELPMCNIGNVAIWKWLAGLKDNEALWAECFEKMLVASEEFAKGVPPSYVKKSEQMLLAYARHYPTRLMKDIPVVELPDSVVGALANRV